MQKNNVYNETIFTPVDIAFAIESFDGDAVLLKHYIDNFVIDSDLMLSEIQDAIDLRQLETTRKMLSTYKGKLEFLADKQSLKIIDRIEKAAKSNDLKKIGHLFLKLVDSYLCIKNYLNGVEFETLT